MQKKLLNKYNIVLGISILIFLIFSLYLAFNLKMGISPDSWYHLRVSQHYAKTLAIPENTPETYQWRDIENIPYLYFWINGRILNINDTILHFNQVILLRIINIIYSLLTITGVFLLSKSLIKNKWGRIIPVILVCNTLMYVFLSSSINYDNLANMFATYAIYFFTMSIKVKGKIQYPLLTILMLCLGALTKFTILPLAAIIVPILIFEIIKNWNTWKLNIKGKPLFWSIPVLVFGILNILLYGNNIFTYHELVPSCEKVLTHEQCLENGVYLRDTVWIPEVEVNLPEMILSGERLNPIKYAGIWTVEMIKKTVGIMGDKSLYHEDIIPTFFVYILIISIVIGIKNWKKYTQEHKYLIGITIFYLLILMIFQNYSMYLKRGYPSLALHGRYMFPVISSLYTVLSITWLSIENKHIRRIYISIVLLLLILTCLPFFILNVDSGWFGDITY